MSAATSSPALAFCMQRMVGSLVKVQRRNAEVIVGILSRVDTNTCDVTLKLVQTLQKDASAPFAQPVPKPTPKGVTSELVVKGDDILQLHADNINLGFRAPPPSASGGVGRGFTDSEISGGQSQPSTQRMLQKWAADEDEPQPDLTLDDGEGWSADAMMRENELRYGCVSSYKEEDYTTALDTSQPDFEKRRRAAEAEAKAIQKAGRGADDGEDTSLTEEEKYSEVLDTASKPSKQAGEQKASSEKTPTIVKDLQEFQAKFHLGSARDKKVPANDTSASPTEASAEPRNQPKEVEDATKKEKKFEFNPNAAEFVPSFAVAASPQTPPQQAYHPMPRGPSFSGPPLQAAYAAPQGYVRPMVSYAPVQMIRARPPYSGQGTYNPYQTGNQYYQGGSGGGAYPY